MQGKELSGRTFVLRRLGKADAGLCVELMRIRVARAAVGPGPGRDPALLAEGRRRALPREGTEVGPGGVEEHDGIARVGHRVGELHRPQPGGVGAPAQSPERVGAEVPGVGQSGEVKRTGLQLPSQGINKDPTRTLGGGRRGFIGHVDRHAIHLRTDLAAPEQALASPPHHRRRSCPPGPELQRLLPRRAKRQAIQVLTGLKAPFGLVGKLCGGQRLSGGKRAPDDVPAPHAQQDVSGYGEGGESDPPGAGRRPAWPGRGWGCRLGASLRPAGFRRRRGCARPGGGRHRPAASATA